MDWRVLGWNGRMRSEMEWWILTLIDWQRLMTGWNDKRETVLCSWLLGRWLKLVGTISYHNDRRTKTLGDQVLSDSSLFDGNHLLGWLKIARHTIFMYQWSRGMYVVGRQLMRSRVVVLPLVLTLPFVALRRIGPGVKPSERPSIYTHRTSNSDIIPDGSESYRHDNAVSAACQQCWYRLVHISRHQSQLVCTPAAQRSPKDSVHLPLSEKSQLSWVRPRPMSEMFLGHSTPIWGMLRGRKCCLGIFMSSGLFGSC